MENITNKQLVKIDEEQSSRTVFASWGRLSGNVSSPDYNLFKRYFVQKYGYVENCYINAKNPINGTIRFKNINSAQQCIQEQPHFICGLQINCEILLTKETQILLVENKYCPIIQGNKGINLQNLSRDYEVIIKLNEQHERKDNKTTFTIRGIKNRADVQGCVNEISRLVELKKNELQENPAYHILTVVVPGPILLICVKASIAINPINIAQQTGTDIFFVGLHDEQNDSGETFFQIQGSEMEKTLLARNLVEKLIQDCAYQAADKLQMPDF